MSIKNRAWRPFAAFLCAGLAASLCLSSAAASQQVSVREGEISVDAAAAIVMEYQSGRVLFAQNSGKKLAMASTTKIMTALLTLEQPDRDEYFVVDSYAIHIEGTTMGLQEGDQATLNQLAVGMLLPSGNDAAGAAAVRIAGSKAAFVEQMNERARQIGMENTHYVTVEGLDADEHYSTAYDMALLTREALANEDFREICSQEQIRLKFGNPPYDRTLYNTNKLLESYPYAIGVKTGLTDNAGKCLVSAAEKDGVTLIVVTLNAHGDYIAHEQLYEKYFAQLDLTNISSALGDISVSVAGGIESGVRAVLVEEPTAVLGPGEYKQLRSEIEAPKFLYAPVEQGEIVGRVTLYVGSEAVFESDLAAEKSIIWLYPPKKEWSFLSRIFK